jgi:hypothetical protein
MFKDRLEWSKMSASQIYYCTVCCVPRTMHERHDIFCQKSRFWSTSSTVKSEGGSEWIAQLQLRSLGATWSIFRIIHRTQVRSATFEHWKQIWTSDSLCQIAVFETVLLFNNTRLEAPGRQETASKTEPESTLYTWLTPRTHFIALAVVGKQDWNSISISTICTYARRIVRQVRPIWKFLETKFIVVTASSILFEPKQVILHLLTGWWVVISNLHNYGHPSNNRRICINTHFKSQYQDSSSPPASDVNSIYNRNTVVCSSSITACKLPPKRHTARKGPPGPPHPTSKMGWNLPGWLKIGQQRGLQQQDSQIERRHKALG